MNAAHHAAELARQGLPVFPCRADKAPACEHGFRDATSDPAAVAALWRRSPGPLIGVPTGTVSGFDVLDLDPRHGGHEWWALHRHRIPDTRMHRTRSDGLHVLLQHAEPVRNTASKIGPGVDTRGEGGFIVWWPAAGCRVADVPIAPWPDWLLRRLLFRRERPRPRSGTSLPLASSDAAQRLAEWVLARLRATPAGQRHYALRKAAYTLGGLLDRLPFGEAEATERLVKAVEQAGAEDLAGATKTAAWGLERGRAAPLAGQGPG